jgi:hypothetical protein
LDNSFLFDTVSSFFCAWGLVIPDQFRDDRKESAMTQTSKPQSAARSRLHLIRFHGVLAPNAALRVSAYGKRN